MNKHNYLVAYPSLDFTIRLANGGLATVPHRATIYVELKKENTEDVLKSTFGLGIAVCSANDNFSRPIGKDIAGKRAQYAEHVDAGVVFTLEDALQFSTNDEGHRDAKLVTPPISIVTPYGKSEVCSFSVPWGIIGRLSTLLETEAKPSIDAYLEQYEPQVAQG